MNNGFFGFPTPIGISNNIIDIKEFDSSGTYGVPPNAKRLYIFLVGAGTGGGGGARQPTTSGGGAGGSGGKIISYTWTTEELGFNIGSGIRAGFGSLTSPYQRLIITIGAGSNGGLGATVNATSGGAVLSAGGTSTVNISGYATGTTGLLMLAEGGSANGGALASGGSTGGGATGSSGLASIHGFYSNSSLGNGGSGGAVGGGSTITVINSQYNGGAGGGGGTGGTGGNITPVASTSTSQSGVLNSNYVRGSSVISGGTANNPGTDAFGYTIHGKYSHGFGGGGGGGSTGGSNAGRGGNGFRGSGGGGGGGSINGANGGDGGKGGDGYCLIVAYG
jgi:hypothetical protein